MDAIILGVRGLLAHPPDPDRTDPRCAGGTRLRSALRSLATSGPLVLLERGPADPLETWAIETGAATLATFRLWTARLGDQARPPSRLPFRFIQRRLEIACSHSLYIGCDDGILSAARRAGCPTWDVREPAGSDVPQPVIETIEWLQEPLES